MKRIFTSILLLSSIVGTNLNAQGLNNLSGDLMLQQNFFQRDTSINASDNELYDHLLSGGESWLGLRYSHKGFVATLRVDGFLNSNLKEPTQAMSGINIGAWSLSKDVAGLRITGGYIYDQVGSGILFRAYEDRGLLIDNALKGIHLRYQLGKNVTLKAFGGQQKNVFESYAPIIKGFNAEGSYKIGDKVYMVSGVGLLNRTMDKRNMDLLVSNINALPAEKRFEPKYNMYGGTFYNTLTAGAFSWYLEGAYKTSEAISDYNGQLMNANGTVLYSSMFYAMNNFAITLTGKRTENFIMRTSPNQALLDGVMNWQPVVAQLRPHRLIARYSPASQDLSEYSFNADFLINPNDFIDINVSGTYINTLDDLKLYREAFIEANIRRWSKWDIDLGFQYMEYNQDYYQFKPGVPLLVSYTPFTELTYRLTGNKSLKFQGQYMHTRQDYGSWAFASLEYAVANKWSVAVSDMYNVSPVDPNEKGKHYYNFFASYTKGPHRISLAYVKQVEGINCTGGVCRYEPAFNGLKLQLLSSF
ncbi:MAG TPA: DUF6029 family protein [Chitinophagaceae bacterium]|nr:DUF6029 family protein [Chitinophagaceae bacterium]